MNQTHHKKHILVIDRQTSWCEFSTQVLHDAGYSVEQSGDYQQPSPSNSMPDLVLLGCMQVGPTEQQLITSLLEKHCHLLVLGVSISKTIMRSLYLQGVDDIVDKPYSPKTLVSIVNQALDHIALHENFALR